MHQVGQETRTDQLITKYFLDRLTERQRQQVEERCFADSEFLERMQAVEAELIEDYVRGVLPRDAAEKFEGRMLTSRHQQQKVEFAGSLLRSLEQEIGSLSLPAERKNKNWQNWLPSLLMLVRRHFLTPQAAAVVAILATFCLGGCLLLEVNRLRRQLGDLQKEQAAAHSREQELREVIAQQRQSRNTPLDSNAEHPPGKVNANENSKANEGSRSETRPRTNEHSLATFSLSPVLARDEQQLPKQVDIPKNIKAVQIQLLYDGDDFPSYYAVLETADGEKILTKRGLKAERVAGKKLVNLKIPANVLTKRTYIVTLRVSSPSVIDEDVSRYTFFINR